MSDEKLTIAQFAGQCANIAAYIADHAGSSLPSFGDLHSNADAAIVAQFTDSIRERLDHLDEWAGRGAASRWKESPSVLPEGVLSGLSAEDLRVHFMNYGITAGEYLTEVGRRRRIDRNLQCLADMAEGGQGYGA